MQKKLGELGETYRMAGQQLRVGALRAFMLHEAEFLLHQPDTWEDWETFLNLRVAQAGDYLDALLTLHPPRRGGTIGLRSI